jgi:hypothetical protein
MWWRAGRSRAVTLKALARAYSGSDIVEVETESGFVDLHNDAILCDIEIRCRPSLGLRSAFGWRMDGPSS